jgi:hypothetical protein
MTEQIWNTYLNLLAASSGAPPRPCVACWYETHTTPFPASVSSSLCARHKQATRKRRPKEGWA